MLSKFLQHNAQIESRYFPTVNATQSFRIVVVTKNLLITEYVLPLTAFLQKNNKGKRDLFKPSDREESRIFRKVGRLGQ